MRRGGVLVHPTALPGAYGAGDLASARVLLEWIERAGLGIWQFLPLGPTDLLGCPYNSGSAFARDPNLIALGDLVADGWLREDELPSEVHPHLPIDFPAVTAHRAPALAKAAARVAASVDLETWRIERPWVDDWALFAAGCEAHGGEWQAWPEPLRDRHGTALADLRDEEPYRRHLALQWLFAWQWDRLRRDARARGIDLWGDLPIFVAPSSADTWAHRELFLLGDDGRAAAITGVPPDAFSALGQSWGHPHYKLKAHADTGYAWWKSRFAALMEIVDCVRIDHFRGLSGVWHIPADAPDARSGRWEDGFGAPLLEALREVADPLPVVAEDLGVITPDVVALREDFGLPGMAVLQFAFGGEDNVHLPYRHQRNQVVYTGTHDNDTAIGWYNDVPQGVRDNLVAYGGPVQDPAAALVRLAWGSIAETAIAPLQDLLGLDGRYRTNVPGTQTGNWRWRVPMGRLTVPRANAVRRALAIFGRTPLRG